MGSLQDNSELNDEVLKLLHDLVTFLNNLKWNKQLSPDQEQLTDVLIQRSRDQLVLFSTKAYVTMSSPASVDKDEQVEYVDPDLDLAKDLDDISSVSQCTEEEECPYKSMTFKELGDMAYKVGPLYRRKNFFAFVKKSLIYVMLIKQWLVIFESDKKEAKPVITIDITDYTAKSKNENIEDENQNSTSFVLFSSFKKTHEFISKNYKDMMQWITVINNRKTIEKKSTPSLTYEITADVYENPDEILESAEAPTLPPRNPSLFTAPKIISNPYNNSDQNEIMDDEDGIYDEPQINLKKDEPNPLLAAAARYDIKIPKEMPKNEDSYYDKINNVEKSNIDCGDIYDEPGNIEVKPSSEQEEDNIYNDLVQTSSAKNEIRPIKAEIIPKPLDETVCSDLEVVNFFNGNNPGKIEDNDEYYDELSTPVEPVKSKPKPVVKPKPKLNKRLSERFTRKISVDNSNSGESSAENAQSPKKLNLTIIQKMERSLAGNFYIKK